MSKPVWKRAPFVLKLRRTFRIARSASDERDTVYVALHKDGVIGYGEGAPPPRYGETAASSIEAAETAFARAVVPELPGASLDALQAPDLPELRSLQMAIDLALHDWLGKARRAPLHELLGVIPETAPRTSFTIGIDEPDRLAERVKEGDSFDIFKVKLGGPHDDETLAALRRATDRPLRVDANEGWTFETALRRLEQCAEAGVELVEQPLAQGNLEETARLRARSPIPLFADEDFRTAADAARLAGVYDGVNIKMVKCGGIRAALEAIAEARRHGLRVMLGCGIESSLGIAAAAAISPLADFVDLDGAILTANDPIAGIRLVDGRLMPGAGIGLGVTIRDPGLARALSQA